MNPVLRQKIELKIAAALEKFGKPRKESLKYVARFTDPFLETFAEFEAEDPKLMERFVKFLFRLNYVTTGGRGTHNKGLCGANKEDIAQNNVGKANGYRIVFYAMIEGHVWLLFMFAKSDQKDVTPEQKELICQIVEAITEANNKKK